MFRALTLLTRPSRPRPAYVLYFGSPSKPKPPAPTPESKPPPPTPESTPEPKPPSPRPQPHEIAESEELETAWGASTIDME